MPHRYPNIARRSKPLIYGGIRMVFLIDPKDVFASEKCTKCKGVVYPLYGVYCYVYYM
jgi:hypothetical protein